ncbi:MAG: hypothetical protein Q9220_002321 [cf. Caloplaca sp. 1 TL-2023]
MPLPTEQDGASNILPIPPPLEFPFPRDSPESSTGYSFHDTTKSSSPTTSPDAAVPPNTKSTVQDFAAVQAQATEPRPPLEKQYLTEGPKASQRRSEPALQRSHTSDGPATFSSIEDRPTSGVLSSSSEADEEEVDPSTKAPKKGMFKRHPKAPSKRPDYGRFSIGNESFRTGGKVSKTSGRLDISLHETANKGYLAKSLGTSLHHHLQSLRKHPAEAEVSDDTSIGGADRPIPRPILESRVSAITGVPVASTRTPKPTLNIVIMVIGSRGDIQPFLKLAKLLEEDYGHRVRIATHPAFKKFVEQDSGLEFFSVGGNPAELMAFMVKNPGLIPSLATVKAGEIGRKRDSMFEMFQGFWRACINATDDENDPANITMMERRNPFVADAIIANPPSFAHVHCAERLGIPLHLMFTFPYTPTQQFPHPLANIKTTNVDTNYTNFMSYPLVEMM